jgi:hypothetical protein
MITALEAGPGNCGETRAKFERRASIHAAATIVANSPTSTCELEYSLADAFSQFDVVGFSSDRKNGWAQVNLEVESSAADERSGSRFQHVERTPVIGETFNIKRNDRSTAFTSRYGDTRAPWPVHLGFKIAVGGARRENAEDGLLPSEGFRVSKELDHRFGGRTLLNRENDSVGVPHESEEMFQHPVGRIRLRHKLRETASLNKDLRTHQHRITGSFVDVVTGEDHWTGPREILKAENFDAPVQR